ncbi:endonuclease/exonuclease/phosphatase family protein [Clostridium folliculivorans]|uniref:Endonuclease n=1 Tax=Clostridium folliculivorans TaxID=2886038 RepID=A0A9W6DC12_9CLOT|nr:endonuclease/exonuclease/phosphatase family protein [Clostridium folliculivorans]GKU27015.1 endonuclease [Clostridium folliculivorans]GKU29143.1 endonuclease [Clostridium folliculivorans]
MKESINLRLMTFNILVDRRTDEPYSWEYRREQILSILKYYNPDIFCIQEALENQKVYLEENLPEYSCFGIGRNDGNLSGEQVPIFHRKNMFDLEDQGCFWLSETPSIAGSIGYDAKCPRTVIWKQLKHKSSNNTFIIANTHYDHVGKAANSKSIHVIKEQLSLFNENIPVILCGDFNSSEQAPAYDEILSQGFIDASKTETTIYYSLPFTYHRFMMSEYKSNMESLQRQHDRIFRAIDHVFYHGSIEFTQYGVLPDNRSGVYPSDHFPVLCDFNL